MAEWRLGRGWTEAELAPRLAALEGRERNFTGGHRERMADPAWEAHGSSSVVATAPPGAPEPGGAFRRGQEALEAYAFSDPAIVEAHFSRSAALAGRRMLLELKPGPLHYLCGVVVAEVRDETQATHTRFGYRYDTLEGHIERGSEWFLLEQDHATGRIRFSIEASWRRGDFPNWWSAAGFALVGRRYQHRWHHRAHHRLAALMAGAAVRPRGGRLLMHGGPEVELTGFGGRRPAVESRDG